MSSSDPSDLVDSDEGDSPPSPRSLSQRRLQLVTPAGSATSAGASSAPKRRPGGDGGAGAKKRSRLEPSDDAAPTGLGSRVAKGKGKAVSCSGATTAAVPKSRRSPRKGPQVDQSSSWQSSGNATPAVSAAKKGVRRGRRRPNTTAGTRKSGIDPHQTDSDSSYVCDDDDGGGGVGGGAGHGQEGEEESELELDASNNKGRGRRTAVASGTRRQVRTAARGHESVADTATTAVTRTGARTRSEKTASEKASDHRSDSDGEEEEVELPSRGRRSAWKVANDGKGDGNGRRAGVEETRRAMSGRRIDSSCDSDDQPSLRRLVSTANTDKRATGPGGGAKRGARGGGGGGGRTSSVTPIVLSDDDDDDCLRNTDSDDDAARAETVGGGGDGDEDSGSEGDGPVLCRCGARDWQDGSRWVRCDARGCRTWEHVGCAYPEAEQDEDGGGGKKPPRGGHLCDACRAKGGTLPATAEKQARKGGRRSLTRCGDDVPVTPRSETPLEASPLADAGAGTGTSRVRRSQRVSRREGTRLLLRKNVVGAAGVLSSSSEDEASLLRAGVAGFDGGGGGGGGGNGSSEAGSDEDSDGFWAPEGRVEMTQEYRCRCGGTREGSSARSGGSSGGGGGAADGAMSGRWVQCHSDACGVWEHAACCDHGCCSPPRSSALPAETTATAAPGDRARRHWCLPCDPKGKKHARWKEKRQRKLEQQRLAETTTAPDGAAAAASGAARGAREQKKKKNEAEERFGILLERLWGAVFRGNVRLLEDTFRELEDGGGGQGASVGQALEAGQLPPPSGCLELGSCFSSGGGSDDCVKGEIADGGGVGLDAPAVCHPLPAGLSLLMLAAGYWKIIVEDAPERAPEASKNETINAAAGLIEPGQIQRQPPVAAEAAASVAATPDTEVKTEIWKQAATKTTTEAAPAAPVTASTTRRVAFSPLGSEARLEVLRMVLERGGERAVLAVDGEGRTALHHAAAVDGAREAAALLGAGALGKEAAHAMNHERLTPLHVAAAVGSTAACISILRALAPGPRARVLAAGCGAPSARESNVEEPPDESVLHLACLEGRAACVQAILDEEGRMEKELAEEMTSHVLTGVPAETPPTHRPLALVKTAEGATALMAAAGCPSPPCVDLILGHLRERVIPPPGSKLTELRAVDQAGMNALHYAAGRDEEGSVGVAKALLDAERCFARSDSAASVVWRGWGDEAMINGGDANNDASPLHLAAAISHKDMVSLLLSEGANSVMPDRQGWTPVMYADFAGRKEGAVLELLQHEPEKQLEALGRVLSYGGGGGIGGGRSDPHERHRHQHHSRIVEVVRNLATVPSFFSLVNGFIRRRPDLLLGSLSFLRNEPGLLDFENKRSLMRALLARPDEDTQNALDIFAHYPMAGFGYDYNPRIVTSRGAGRALGALLSWMESAACRWGEGGLAAWLRINRPSFDFLGEAGYGQGVDREAWEMIAGDLVLPFPPTSPPGEPPLPPQQQEQPQEIEVLDGDHPEKQSEAFFIPVEEGMSSYCPRGLSGDRGDARAGGDVGGGSTMRGQREREKDLQAFELLGIVVGAHLSWDKVLNLNLNPVVWKTILSRKVRLSDLELVDPTYHKSLVQVLEMEGVDQLGLSFECLELQFCAEGRDVDPDDAITDDNKAFYASLAVESRTSGRWRKQAKALAHGLRRMVPLGLLKMFTENELGLLLAGPGDIDPDDWERNAEFRGEASTVLQMWFWSVVRSLTKEERSLLLQFATGCSRLPAGGFRGLAPRVFTVVVVEYLPERPLPMAATCFYMLKLPRYPDLYSLRKYLLVAIRHGAAGFEFS